ncbi:MAG: triphosphoribosyl-dephospho-CoA synthase [Promethearchaeota archaeon]
MGFDEFVPRGPAGVVGRAVAATLLEVSTWPKPGNVHRTRGFQRTRFEHFVAGDCALVVPLFGLVDECWRKGGEGEVASVVQPPGAIGRAVHGAALEVTSWQRGGNVNLGQTLLLVPLVHAALKLTCAGSPEGRTVEDLRSEVVATTRGCTELDSVELVRGIRAANPGGLGDVDKFDVTDPSTEEVLLKEKVTPLELFSTNEDEDAIAGEWSSGFERTFERVYPSLVRHVETRPDDFNAAAALTFLDVLASEPDTLIRRKAGLDEARRVRFVARQLRDELDELQKGFGEELVPFHPDLSQRLLGFDEELQAAGGRLNPGTTADLLGAALFVGLSFGMRP